MSRLSIDGTRTGSFGRPQDPAIMEVLRDVLLLLAAIGVSLFVILALSLVLPGQPQRMRIGSGAPATLPEREHAAPLAPGQVVASAERRRPAWRVAAQE